MRVALSTHLFAFHQLDDRLVSLFPLYGFSAAELWAMPPHFPYLDPEAADRIGDRFRRHGVEVVALHAPLYPDVRSYRKDPWYSLSSDDDEHRRRSVDATAEAGRWLGRHGGGTLVLHTSFPPDSWYPGRWMAFQSSLNELCEVVPDAVRFAVENTPVASGEVDIVRDIALRYPADRVGVCLDLGHAHIRGNIPSAIRALGPRLLHVHAHDNRGDRDDHLVPGRGTIAWKPVIAALEGAGFRGPFSVELRDTTRGEAPEYGGFEEILSECRKALGRILRSAR